MIEKEIKTRIKHKHGTAEDWSKSSLVPLMGELIIYDADSSYSYKRFKIGDGATNVNNLPFASGSNIRAGNNITIIDNQDGSISIQSADTQIHIGDNEPEGNENIWIDTDDKNLNSQGINHNDLLNKNDPAGQHNIDAISGLRSELDRIESLANSNIFDHGTLNNRNTMNQHTIESITGLENTITEINNNITNINSNLTNDIANINTVLNTTIKNTSQSLTHDQATQARRNLKMGTTLWSGSWASGSITVPNTLNYYIYEITMSGMGTTILAVRYGNHIRGIGGYTTATPTTTTYQIAATIEDDKWTLVGCTSVDHKSSSSHTAPAERTVTSIVGML